VSPERETFAPSTALFELSKIVTVTLNKLVSCCSILDSIFNFCFSFLFGVKNSTRFGKKPDLEFVPVSRVLLFCVEVVVFAIPGVGDGSELKILFIPPIRPLKKFGGVEVGVGRGLLVGVGVEVELKSVV
jgi:hypothetical protein